MSRLDSTNVLPPSAWWRMLGTRPPATRLPEGLDVAWEASAAAIVAALVILATHWTLIDPLLSLLQHTLLPVINRHLSSLGSGMWHHASAGANTQFAKQFSVLFG